jgi:hypothetical protein
MEEKMNVIWKYPLGIGSIQHIEMPENPKPLCVQVQRDHPTLWCQVNPDNPVKVYTVEVVTTGLPHGYLNLLQYVGTFQLDNGDFVGHVFFGGYHT